VKARELEVAASGGGVVRLLAWCFAAPLLLAAGLGFLQDDYNGLLYFTESGFRPVVDQLVSPGAHFQRPFAYLVFYLEHRLFGTWAFGWHLAHLGLFAIAAGLTGKLARALGGERAAPWAVAFALVYPSRVEVYSWIAAIPDLLALVLVLTALDLAVAISRRVSPSALACAGLFILAAVAPLAKEVAWCLPIVLLAWSACGVPADAAPRGRRWALAAALGGGTAAAVFRLSTLGGVGGYAGTSLRGAVAGLLLLPTVLAKSLLMPADASGTAASTALDLFTAAAFLSVLVGGLLAGRTFGAGWPRSEARGSAPLPEPPRSRVRSRLGRAGVVLCVAGLVPVLPYLTSNLVHEQSRYFAISGAGAAMLAAAWVARGGRVQAWCGAALLTAWTLAGLANIQPWLTAARLRDRTLAAIGAATAAPGPHVVWVRGNIGDLPGGAKVLGGALQAAVRLGFPGRSITAESELFQRLVGKPPAPPAGPPGATVHVITVSDRPRKTI
jgi:hypothetical protein